MNWSGTAMQFCDGTNWNNMGVSGGSAGYGAVWSSSSAVTYDAALYVDTTNHALGIGTTSPSTKAVLDMVSTTKGFLPPRMTTTQKNAITPAEGMVVYELTLHKLAVYTGSVWETVTSL